MESSFFSQLGVSRETLARLEVYAGLLEKWNRKINLVSRNTISAIWARHIEDSAQLLCHVDGGVDHWLDLGSGGGLPGIVVAIIGSDMNRVRKVTLVESDARKCVFLSEVARTLSLPVTILNKRIEDIEPQAAQVISARALASLSALLRLSRPHMAESTLLLLPKGANFRKEIDDARVEWEFEVQINPSHTDADAAILAIRNLKKKTES